jgi:hypothetical protein
MIRVLNRLPLLTLYRLSPQTSSSLPPLDSRITDIRSRRFTTFKVAPEFPPITLNISKSESTAFTYWTAKGLMFCFPGQDDMFKFLNVNIKDIDQKLIDEAVKRFGNKRLLATEIKTLAAELISFVFPDKATAEREAGVDELAEVLQNCVKWNAPSNDENRDF